MINCVVFGSTGFIGRRLVTALMDNHAIVSEPTARLECYEDVEKAVRGAQAVFNCAAIADTKACIENPRRAYEVNVMGAVNILEACRRNNIDIVVLSSSNIVYGPDTPYKTTILACEAAGYSYAKNYGMSVASLRYANVYGPGKRKTPLVVENFLAQRNREQKITILGDGSQMRDFIHVDDVAEAIVCAAQKRHSGVLDICTGVQTSLLELARLFRCPVEFTYGRAQDAPSLEQSPAAATNALGWSAKIPIERGIAHVL